MAHVGLIRSVCWSHHPIPSLPEYPVGHLQGLVVVIHSYLWHWVLYRECLRKCQPFTANYVVKKSSMSGDSSTFSVENLVQLWNFWTSLHRLALWLVSFTTRSHFLTLLSNSFSEAVWYRPFRSHFLIFTTTYATLSADRYAKKKIHWKTELDSPLQLRFRHPTDHEFFVSGHRQVNSLNLQFHHYHLALGLPHPRVSTFWIMWDLTLFGLLTFRYFFFLRLLYLGEVLPPALGLFGSWYPEAATYGLNEGIMSARHDFNFSRQLLFSVIILFY